MKRRPNRELTEEQEEAADAFISGAEEPPSRSPTGGQSAGDDRTKGPVYPWEEAQVREDVKQTYPLRLPEPLHLKLKFLSDKTGRSMNDLCNEAVRGLVNDRLEDVLDNASGA